MTNIKPDDITRRIPYGLIEPKEWQSTAEFRYDRKDPFAVAIAFDTDDEEMTWVFARDLLTQGLVDNAGIGDVRVCPDAARLMLMLFSPDGESVMAFDASEVRRFLAATYRAVPRGRESQHLDLDGLIDELLDGER